MTEILIVILTINISFFQTDFQKRFLTIHEVYFSISIPVQVMARPGQTKEKLD